jgi:hypothetical protein
MEVEVTLPPPAPNPVMARYSPGLQKRHAPLSSTCMNGLQGYERDTSNGSRESLLVAPEERQFDDLELG